MTAIIIFAIFVAGITIGYLTVVTIGVKREERRFREIQRRREEIFFQTGEVQPGYFVPEDPQDRVTWGARWATGLWVRRQLTLRPQDQDQDQDQDLNRDWAVR